MQQNNTEQSNSRLQHRDQRQHKSPTRQDLRSVSSDRHNKVQAVSNEDQQEATTEKILLEQWVTNTEGLSKEQTTEGMKQEIRSMKAQQVYTETEVSFNRLTADQRSKIIKSRWVLRQKGSAARARIVAKGYTEDVKDIDDIYASTPIFCVLRLLLTMSLTNNWTVRAGDISTAFLHAKAATNDLFMYPPTDFYNPEDQVVWKLNKAIYGLRSCVHAWQKHLAETLQQLGRERLASEPNVFKTAAGNAFVLCYVDDLQFLGETTVVNKLFTDIQQHLLLRPTGDLAVGPTRVTTTKFAWQKATQQNYSTKQAWATADQHRHHEQRQATQILSKHSMLKNIQHTEEQLANYNGWHTQDQTSATQQGTSKVLDRATTADQQKPKHLLRYIKGTQHYKFYIRPTVSTTEIKTSEFTSTATGQDVQQHGSQRQASSSNTWEQQDTSEAAHKQQ